MALRENRQPERAALLARSWRPSAIVFALLLVAAPAVAAEPYQDFLRGLWDRGYGEAAIDYLAAIHGRSDLPRSLQETFDLAEARSLRVAADEADSPEIAAQRLTSARTYLDKFLKEHADHADVPAANLLAGGLILVRADELLRQAQATEDSQQRSGKMHDARAEFVEARPHFERAAEKFGARLAPLIEKEQAELAERAKAEAKAAAEASRNRRPGRKTNAASASAEPAASVPAAPAPPSERMRVEEQWADARFKAVLTDYKIAQTYSDPDDSRRLEALRTASAGFDEIYQAHRDDHLGMVAHYWQGRMLEELDDLTTAKDVYDEVLARAAAGLGDLPPAVAELLCDAESHRLQVLQRRKKLDLAIEDAKRWLSLKGADRHTQANMAVVLELAKLQLTKAETSPDDAAAALRKSATAGLLKVAGTKGQHQREALLLLRNLPGQANVAANMQQALGVASAAAENGLWDEAIKAYRRAVDLGHEPRDHDALMTARYDLARVQMAAGDNDAALQTAERLAGDMRVGEMGPKASMLALSISINQFGATAAKDKEAANRRVEQTAEKVIARWPGRPEADDARLAVARLKLVQNDFAAALPWLEAVKSSSPRYAASLYLTAQTYWRLHLNESRQATDKQPATAASANQTKALRALQTLIELERKGKPAGAPPTESQREAIMLLAEMYLAAGETAKIGPLLEPLLAGVENGSGQLGDPTVLRALALATRAYLAQNETDKAATAAQLLENGPDERQVNGALVDYARYLRKQAAGKPSVSPQFVALVEKLSQRQNYSLAERIFLGTIYRDLGRHADAARFFRAALDQADQEPTKPSKQMAGILTQVRLVLVDMLRDERKYEAANAEVDRLIADNPRLLDPMLKKAEVLQAWSTVDPEKLDGAAGQWIRVRSALQVIHPTPPQYYDAVYNTAECLYRLGIKTKDQVKIVDAEKILKAALVLNAGLNGPATVARFNGLLQQIYAELPATKPAGK